MKKTILISGANSSMAKTFVKQFCDKYDFIGIDKSDKPDRQKYSEFMKWDITTNNNPEIKQKIDILIHYAGLADIKECEENKNSAFSANVLGTFNILEFAKSHKIKKFVNISTGGVYKNEDGGHTEESLIEPINFYGLTKLLAEKLCKYYSKDFEVVTIRPFFPYGPDTHPERLINRLILKIKDGSSIQLNKEGKPRINPCYIDDFNSALDSIIEYRGENYSEYNIGGGETASIKEISEIIGDVAGKIPVFDYTQKEAFNILSDNSKISKIFKAGTGLFEGMKKTIESMYKGGAQ